jgi:hypothetical protein
MHDNRGPASVPRLKGEGGPMYRRTLVLVVLLVALALIAAPAVIAALALLRGDAEEAWSVFGVAEAVRFELTKGVNPCRFSRPVP